jgi:4-hydroxy-tetrahydrodipicolinate synthase
MPRRWARTPRFPSRPITTSPRRKAFIAISPAVAEAVDIPIVLYNIPGRSIVEISTETMAGSQPLPNIVGVKDATGNVARASRDRAALPKNSSVFPAMMQPLSVFMAHGGVGCISVTSNVAPKLCAEFQNACLAGDYAKAVTYQDRLMALHDALFCEASPSPTKYAASLLGLCDAEVRLPHRSDEREGPGDGTGGNGVRRAAQRLIWPRRKTTTKR